MYASSNIFPPLESVLSTHLGWKSELHQGVITTTGASAFTCIVGREHEALGMREGTLGMKEKTSVGSSVAPNDLKLCSGT